MARRFDFVAIGSGTAAQVAVHRMTKAGKSCAVMDYRPYGGTCALRGCDPKKMLVSAEEVLAAFSRMQGHGVDGDIAINWSDLQAFKRSFTDPVPEKQQARYDRADIATFHGQARFNAPQALEVDGERIEASHILIATGARPRPLSIDGESNFTHSDAFLELEKLPERILFVGGGYIGAELAHLAARAGAKVTIVQRSRILQAFDPDIVDWLTPSFEELNIDIIEGEVTGLIQEKGGLRVQFNDQQFEVDMAVHSAGRVPALAALDLEAGDIAQENDRLLLTPQLRSQSNDHVYAAGDAAAMGPPLTPVSSHDAKVVVENILEGNNREPNYKGVPSALFTVPPAARVGLLEGEARDAGLEFEIDYGSHPEWFSARRLNANIYGHKLLIELGSKRILGAHLVGPGADEVINIFAVAVRHGLNADDLKDTMFAYPTSASDVGYMLD